MNDSVKEKIKNIKPLIKPCPFCFGGGVFDSKVELVEGKGRNPVALVYAYRCPNCGAQSAFKETIDEARKLWNRRGKLEREAKLISRTKPIKGTKGCILSSTGSCPHFRVYRKDNPDGVVTPGAKFDDYYLDLNFLFDLWMEIDDDPMEYKEYLQPDGEKIKILGYTEFAWKGGKKYPKLKPGETQIL
jgi:Restriction alleviation protein Lar